MKRMNSLDNVDEMPQEFYETMDGLLVGDGNLYINNGGTNKGKNAVYQHGSSYKEFVDHIKYELQKFCVTFGPDRVQKQTKRNSIGYHIRSHVSPVFTHWKNRWYEQGKKEVPTDIILSPKVCLYWYLGDGGLHWSGNTLCGLFFSTHAFNSQSILILRTELANFGFISTHRASNNTIALNRGNCLSFLEYVGRSSPVQCYNYKFCTENREMYSLLKSRNEVDNQQLRP